MCSWISEKTAVLAHGKGTDDWINLTTANVYYDHPVSAPLDHALVIDFLDEAKGPSARVAVELSADSARALVRAIEAALAAGEDCHDQLAKAAAHVASDHQHLSAANAGR
jgi:hypothetical protein